MKAIFVGLISAMALAACTPSPGGSESALERFGKSGPSGKFGSRTNLGEKND